MKVGDCISICITRSLLEAYNDDDDEDMTPLDRVLEEKILFNPIIIVF